MSLVASPVCLRTLPLGDVLPALASVGFRKFEAFTGFVSSALDLGADPAAYRAQAQRHGLRFSSFHLPRVTAADVEATMRDALAAARFARDLGAAIVIYKADARDTYVRTARRFLDAVDEHRLGLTTVIQNHAGSAIASVDDYRAIFDAVRDARLKAILEVGHFHQAGFTWRQGLDYLADRVALVHLKDMKAGKSVPYGTGEVDFPALFDALRARGYAGDHVVELESPGGNSVDDVRAAVNYLRSRCGATL
jgi:sugar phosphate isomerase/epimerase